MLQEVQGTADQGADLMSSVVGQRILVVYRCKQSVYFWDSGTKTGRRSFIGVSHLLWKQKHDYNTTKLFDVSSRISGSRDVRAVLPNVLDGAKVLDICGSQTTVVFDEIK